MAHAPNKQDKFHQGKYKIKNVQKYIGDPTDIVYRSSWEYKFMLYCDLNEDILKWGSEVFKIPYVDYLGKSRTYIPDFYLETRNSTNPDFMNKYVIEIKPEKEIREPEIPKNISEKKLKNLEYELGVWQKNKYKWKYAIEWCNNRDMKFWLVTEKHLNNFK
jgi:hypothetical protein